MNNLTESDIINFLWVFDGRYTNDIEYSEFSNEFLYALLCNRNVYLLVKIQTKNDKLPLNSIKQAIENPINDQIDLSIAYRNVKTIKGYKTIKNIILKSIDITISKL